MGNWAFVSQDVGVWACVCPGKSHPSEPVHPVQSLGASTGEGLFHQPAQRGGRRLSVDQVEK